MKSIMTANSNHIYIYIYIYITDIWNAKYAPVIYSTMSDNSDYIYFCIDDIWNINLPTGNIIQFWLKK